MKHIFVTGAGGFIGRNLIPDLIKQGYQVVAFDIIPLQGILENCTLTRGNILDAQSIQAASKGCDAVIHLAGIMGSSDYQKNYQIHVEGTQNLLKACKANNVRRIIAYSSVAATKENPGSYGATKKELEQLFLTADINATILRPTMVLGYKGKGLDTIVKQVQAYPLIPLLGSGKAMRQPIWVKDLTKLTISLLQQKKSYGKTYDVGGEESISFKEFVMKVKNELNIKKPIIPIPSIIAKALAKAMEKTFKKPIFTYENVRNLAMDENINSNILKQELNFVSTPLSQVLPEVLKEYKK